MQEIIEIEDVEDITYCDASHLDIVDRDLLVETVACIDDGEVFLLETDILETLRSITAQLEMSKSEPVELANYG